MKMVSKKQQLNQVFGKSWAKYHWYSSWSIVLVEFRKIQLKYFRHFRMIPHEKILKILKLLPGCQPLPTNMDFPERSRMQPLIPSKEWLKGKRCCAKCKNKTKSRQKMCLNRRIDPQCCSKHFWDLDEQFLRCKLKECCSAMPLKYKLTDVQQIGSMLMRRGQLVSNLGKSRVEWLKTWSSCLSSLRSILRLAQK